MKIISIIAITQITGCICTHNPGQINGLPTENGKQAFKTLIQPHSGTHTQKELPAEAYAGRNTHLAGLLAGSLPAL